MHIWLMHMIYTYIHVFIYVPTHDDTWKPTWLCLFFMKFWLNDIRLCALTKDNAGSGAKRLQPALSVVWAHNRMSLSNNHGRPHTLKVLLANFIWRFPIRRLQPNRTNCSSHSSTIYFTLPFTLHSCLARSRTQYIAPQYHCFRASKQHAKNRVLINKKNRLSAPSVVHTRKKRGTFGFRLLTSLVEFFLCEKMKKIRWLEKWGHQAWHHGHLTHESGLR